MIEDAEELMNLRNWLEEAIASKGAKIKETGLGMGGADLWIELDQMPFFVHIQPVTVKKI